MPSPKPQYLLAGSIGAELCGPLLDMEQIVHHLLTEGKLSRQQVFTLQSSLATARRVATQSQMLDRLAHLPIKQSHEHVQLDTQVRLALSENATLLQGRAVDLVHQLSPIEVVLDPGLLETLLHAALSWIARPGHRLTIHLELQRSTGFALLSFKAKPTVLSSQTEGVGQPEPYRLSWWLLVESASLAQIQHRYSEVGRQLQLDLTFVRTKHHLAQLACANPDRSGDSWRSSESKGFTRHRALLVTTDPQLQAEVEGICRDNEWLVDVAESAVQAQGCSELGRPQLLIVDQRLNGEAIRAVHNGMRHPDHPVLAVEIVQDLGTLTPPGWIEDPKYRIGHANLHAHLSRILLGESASPG
jgi:hypothetical protein